MNKIRQLLEQHQQELERINRQRRIWLYASSVVVMSIVSIIFGWNWIDDHATRTVWWFIVAAALILSVNWWYWTMSVIRRLIVHQSAEYDILGDIVDDIKIVVAEVKNLNNERNKN